MNRDHFVIFEIAFKYSISDSFVDHDGYSISSKVSSELNSPIPVHFSSLTPKLLMFTLAISCLTTSNFPWFMDLTFQVPMQYCSLQHQTLLPSPATFTIGCCFHFVSFSSFFLDLFLHWSPVAYWAPTDLGSSSFSVLPFLPFHTVLGVLNTRILEWFVIPFSNGPRSVRPLHMTLPSWVAPHGIA